MNEPHHEPTPSNGPEPRPNPQPNPTGSDRDAGDRSGTLPLKLFKFRPHPKHVAYTHGGEVCQYVLATRVSDALERLAALDQPQYRHFELLADHGPGEDNSLIIDRPGMSLFCLNYSTRRHTRLTAYVQTSTLQRAARLMEDLPGVLAVTDYSVLAEAGKVVDVRDELPPETSRRVKVEEDGSVRKVYDPRDGEVDAAVIGLKHGLNMPDDLGQTVEVHRDPSTGEVVKVVMPNRKPFWFTPPENRFNRLTDEDIARHKADKRQRFTRDMLLALGFILLVGLSMYFAPWFLP